MVMNLSGKALISFLVGVLSLGGVALISGYTNNLIGYVVSIGFLILICYESVFTTVKLKR